MRNTLDSKIRNTISDNIRYLLQKNNMSQSALAIEIDKSVAQVNSLINGRGTPTLEFIIDVCKYFNITVDTILFENIGENN